MRGQPPRPPGDENQYRRRHQFSVAPLCRLYFLQQFAHPQHTAACSCRPLGRTGLNLILARVDPKAGEASFYVTETPAEYLYAEVSLKPFIILLWIGAVITILGLAVATVRRGVMAGRLRAAVAGERTANGKREAA